METETAINFDGVTKKYSNGKGIFNVSFSVNKGEIFGFLGPNGAGKTTAIRTIMDFMRPDKGSISILGLDSTKDSVKAKQLIGYVPSDRQMYQKLSGREHLNFYTANRENNSSKYAKILKLDLNTPVKHLSSGNKQKLAVLLALVGNPKLLVMDEPTAGLDPFLQQTIYDLLRHYKNNGGTVFLSSHNLPEVEKICDRVGVIKEGRIVADKTMADIRSMSIHIVSVITDQPLNLKTIASKDVEIVSQNDNHAVLKVKGSLNKLLHLLAKQNVHDLEINHANLEDIFLEYYT